MEMLASGLIDLGCHTHRMTIFVIVRMIFVVIWHFHSRISATRFGLAEATLAFPYGFGCRGNDGPELAAAAEEGRHAVRTNDGRELVRPEDDWFNWGRFAALNFDSAASLAAKLNGTYSRMRRAWQRLRASITAEIGPAGLSPEWSRADGPMIRIEADERRHLADMATATAEPLVAPPGRGLMRPALPTAARRFRIAITPPGSAHAASCLSLTRQQSAEPAS